MANIANVKIDPVQLAGRLQGLIVNNTSDPRCVICQVPELSALDRDIFLHTLSHADLSKLTFGSGIQISQKEFAEHAGKHLFVRVPTDAEAEEMSLPDLIRDRLAVTLGQMKNLEKSGQTDTAAYGKKNDQLFTLIDLRGKLEGAFSQKLELSTEFKSLMVKRLSTALDDPEATKALASEMTLAIGGAVTNEAVVDGSAKS